MLIKRLTCCYVLSDWSSFHINCGGEEVPLDGNTIYEADRDPGAPSKFVQSTTNWGFSGTGHFLDDDLNRDSFIWTSSSGLSMKNSELYMNARLSPLSLTYYGFCLVNGIYNVNLHFAEIMFNDGKNYSRLIRRIFNIYIQVSSILCFYSLFLVYCCSIGTIK